MTLLIVLFCVAVLIVLISQFKVSAFLAFLLVSILAGTLLGFDISKIPGSLQKGIGDLLGSLIIVIVSGAMLGKLVAESGAAQQISSSFTKVFGEKNIQWALMIAGFAIGIPLFYNVGFVLVIPLIAAVAERYKLPVIYVGLPMLAALSVTHGFLPPHPAPSALVAQFNADMGKTLVYGMIIGFPTVIVAGLLFSKTLKKLPASILSTFRAPQIAEDKLPSLFNSLISSLLPVILLTATTILQRVMSPDDGILNQALIFIGEPSIAMIISLAVATWSLGLSSGMNMEKVMRIYEDSAKDISIILLIVAGAGALKQVLTDSGASMEIGGMLGKLAIHPLVLGWSIAALVRICVGSATVAGLTTAGIMAPMVATSVADPSLMVLSVGAGSLMFSHVNDSGFWLFKEYFNLSIKQTILSWSIMETIVAFCGLIGVMIIHYLFY